MYLRRIDGDAGDGAESHPFVQLISGGSGLEEDVLDAAARASVGKGGAHDGLPVSAPLKGRERGDVIDAHGPAPHHDRCRGYGLSVGVSHVGGELGPYGIPVEDFAEPTNGHMEADGPDGTERFAGGLVADPADVESRERFKRRKHTLSDHARKADGMAESLALENVAGTALSLSLDEVFADPVRPFESARVEVHGGQKDALEQFRFGCNGGREERGVEHLERDAGRRDADSRKFADFAGGPAGGDYTE